MKTGKEVVLAIMMVVFTGIGCAHKKAVVNENQHVVQTPAPEAVSVGNKWHRAPAIDVVYFNFDDASLSIGARESLEKAYNEFKGHEDYVLYIYGFCDARGSEAYNLALGQKRADALRSYYVSLGLDGNKIFTTSYGKEKQVCEEANELCYKKNRRATTLGGVK